MKAQTSISNPFREVHFHTAWIAAGVGHGILFFLAAAFSTLPAYLLDSRGFTWEWRYPTMIFAILSVAVATCIPKLPYKNKLREPVYYGGILVIPAVAMLLAYLVAVPLASNFNATTFWQIVDYYRTIFFDQPYWSDQYARLWNTAPDFLVEYLVSAAGGAGLIAVAWYATNPFSKIPAFNDARFARIDDVQRMEHERNQIIISKVKKSANGMCHLGIMGDYKIALKENLSVLVLAPAGTGKTAGFLIPSILSSDNVSLVIHDLKPELAQITSAYRAKVSTVLIIDWGGINNPEKGIYYPRWNPLSPKCIPSGQGRDIYIDRICSALLPENKGGDAYWTNSAKNALAGFLHFLVAQVNDHKDYENIPMSWHGKEASLPMLLDWITEATMAADNKAKEGHQGGEQDSFKEFLMAAAEKAKKKKYPYRAVQELVGLASTPDKTRGSTMSTMTTALGVFKNEGVRHTLSACDFDFAQVRGMVNKKTGKSKPMTIYIVVRTEDTIPYAPITGMFFDTLGTYLTSYGPNEVDSRGKKLGPHGVRFCIDEFPQLPPLKSVIQGPAIARSKQLGFDLVAQDPAQIELKYSKPEVEILYSTTAAKLIFTQNNPTGAKVFSEMIGYTTVAKESYSRPEGGLGKNWNLFPSTNVSLSHDKKQLMSPQEIMSMPSGRHLVLIQGYHNRPCYAETPLFFKDPIMRGRAFNPRDPGAAHINAPVNPTPAWLANAIKKSIAAEEERFARASSKVIAKATKRYYIATPAFAASCRRTEDMAMPDPVASDFAFMQIDTPEGQPPFRHEPEMLTDIRKFLQNVGEAPFIFYDVNGFNEMNQKLQAEGLGPLAQDRCVFLEEVFASKGGKFSAAEPIWTFQENHMIDMLPPFDDEAFMPPIDKIVASLAPLHSRMLSE